VADIDAIKAKIEALSPPAKLRLAADLLEAGRGELAHTIADRVATELGAALALAKLGGLRRAE
jgi:hypothetical protein